MLTKVLLFYLGVSISLATIYINRIAKAEKELQNYPVGDVGDCIEIDFSYTPGMYIFFPSIVLVKIYIGVVRIINNLL